MPLKNIPIKTYFNWSSGKDAALALYYLQTKQKCPVDLLLTSVNSHHGRVSMHGLRNELLDRQIENLGIDASIIELPEEPDMEEYERILLDKVKYLKAEGYNQCAFGDIFLEDLREYREKQLAPYGIKALFPLWNRPTKDLIHEFLDLGFKAIVICADAQLLEKDFVGQIIDQSLIDSLPPGVDPCGENGEFHTFCFDGPIFQKPVNFTIGQKVYKTYQNPDSSADASEKEMGFWYGDLL